MTSDINNYFVYSFHVTHCSFYMGLAFKIIFGPLNFWIVFIIVEMMKSSLHLSFAIFNISTFVQMSLILNYEWVFKKNDKVFVS